MELVPNTEQLRASLISQSPMPTVGWSGVKCFVTALRSDQSRFSIRHSDGRVWV